jgi:hypothetical protein
VEERELHVPVESPLIGWRLFRVRPTSAGCMLTAPLIHDPDFERFPSRSIRARCYEQGHAAPAPRCRCGLYATVEGTLDSLAGYLSDSSHDQDPSVFAEVACTGRVFLDTRGVRAEAIEILRLVLPERLWPDAEVRARTARELTERYRVPVGEANDVPEWVIDNVMPQGAPTHDAEIDLDALVSQLARLPHR